MAPLPLPLRCKTRQGQQMVENMTTETSIADFKAVLSSLSDISYNALRVLSGFPPQPLDLSNESAPLSTLNLKPRDTVIIEEMKIVPSHDNDLLKNKASVGSVDNHISNSPLNGPTIHGRDAQSLKERNGGKENSLPEGLLMRQTVPSDNSCLFTSIYYCITGGELDHKIATVLRKLIADQVTKDPGTYNEGFLGQTNSEYCKWIMNSDHWGGAIELSILSQYYEIEIVAVDTINLRLNRFGEDKDYDQRIFLIYDGIHYDPLKYEPNDHRKHITTIFPTSDAHLLSLALEVAREAKASKQFTDVQNFTLKCTDCGKKLTGQSQARTHAKETGHINFGEV